MTSKRLGLHRAAWTVVGGNLSQALAFIMFVAICRVVGPAAFGAVAISLALVEPCRALSSKSVVSAARVVLAT
jgi:O-antigen/teichoic acid export membrane protein